jgi:hypothetical protein
VRCLTHLPVGTTCLTLPPHPLLFSFLPKPFALPSWGILAYQFELAYSLTPLLLEPAHSLAPLHQ